MKIILYLLIISSILVTSSCYGPRINKKNIDNVAPHSQPIVKSNDNSIELTLEKLLVRNDSYSWAKDANWDEYVFLLENLTNSTIVVQEIVVINGLDIEVTSRQNRKDLNKSTKLVKRLFKNFGIKLKIGEGSTQMLEASISATVLGAGLGATAASGGTIGLSAGTLTTAGGAVFIAVPAIAIGSVIKLMNNRKINNEILKRQTYFPVTIRPYEKMSIDVFYPVIPGPIAIVVEYKVDNKMKFFKQVLSKNLSRLHYKSTAKK